MLKNVGEKWIYTTLIISFIGLLLFEATLPPIIGNKVIPNLDKLAHFTAFGLLAFFIIKAFLPSNKRVCWLSITLICLIAIGVSIADEVIQSFTAGRDADVKDIIAGFLGAFVISLGVKLRRKNQ